MAWLGDVAQMMRVMDLFVLPSLAEGSFSVILEAMASALPVVATNVGGTAVLIRTDWNGILVPRSAPALLAEATANYGHVPGLARRHGARGRRIVLAGHSLEAMANLSRALRPL